MNAEHSLASATTPDTTAVTGPGQPFRAQFVLGPKRVEQLTGGHSYALAEGTWLTVDSQLPVTQVREGDRALTVVGYMLDPLAPESDDRDILTQLLASCASIRALTASLADLGGRWVLAAQCGDGLYLVPDALGLRQALYTQPTDTNGLWVMSQPGLAMEILGLGVDPQAADFLDSYVVRATQPEYCWPGTSTPLRGLRRLLPNHVLDLRTAQVRRYWPESPLPTLSLDDGVDRITRTMTGLIAAASARFPLALSLTAGADSRLVLAAARHVKEHLCYITLRQAKMADDSADLAVPSRLLARLGLPHEIVRAAGHMSPEFSWSFKRNVFLAHDHYGADAEAILARFGRRKVAMTGSGAEVARAPCRRMSLSPRRTPVTAAELARTEGLDHPYALRFYQDWLDDVDDRGNERLLNLFEWEQGQGSWLAQTQLEFDIAWRDIFTPYNCRSLLATMLSVDERFRRPPDYRLFTLAAARLWPDALSEPINPHKRSHRMKQLLDLFRQGVRVCLRPA